MRLSPTLADRFWSKVDKSGGQDACWPWIGHIGTNGYGDICVDGKKRVASRVAFTLCSGPIPAGLFVLHRCDNPPCCNPAHLFLGKPADNSADMVAKGRVNKTPRNVGRQNKAAKLTENDVLLMRQIRTTQRLTYAQIAAQFGVATATVAYAVRGIHWKHLGDGASDNG